MGNKARVIAICNEKGGTGKTVTTCNLSAGLRRKGYKVLMIDLDSQCSLSKSLYALNEDNSIVPVMGGLTPIEETIQTVAQGDIISSRRTVGAVDLWLMDIDKEFALKKAIQPVMDKYDFILLDCAPTISTLTINAFTASTSVIIPTEAKTSSLQGLEEVIATIAVVKERYNPELKIEGILITRYNARTILAQEVKAVLEERAQEIGTRVFSRPIRDNTAIAEAQAYLTDIFAWSPRSNGAEDYKSLVEEVIAGV